MKNRILACAALLFAAFSPAMAEDGCQPLEEAISDLAAAGAPKSDVIVLNDPVLTRKYMNELPINVPAGSSPVSLLFARSSNGVVVGLVEPEGCIRFGAVVPLDEHRRAIRDLMSEA